MLRRDFLKNRLQVYRLHEQCAAFGMTPAEAMGIKHRWVAWQFNNAVSHFGRYINNKMEERDEKGKRVNRIETLLGVEAPVRRISLAQLTVAGVDVELVTE